MITGKDRYLICELLEFLDFESCFKPKITEKATIWRYQKALIDKWV